MTGGQAPLGCQMSVSMGTFEHYMSTRHSHPSTLCSGGYHPAAGQHLLLVPGVLHPPVSYPAS